MCCEFCPLDAPASEANCAVVLRNLLVLSGMGGCLRRGEVNKREKELKE